MLEYNILDVAMYISPFIHNFPDYKTIYDNRKEEFMRLGMKDLNSYFVEFFSWSPIPFDCLFRIHMLLKKLGITKIYDPCAGSGYHAFLFNKILKYEVTAVDLQPENFSNKWYNVTENNCLKMDKIKPSLLILSWMDYQELSEKLLDKYKPNYVMLIGIYHRSSESQKFYETMITQNEFIEEFDLIPFYEPIKKEKITLIKMLK
ncbi:hypothetical protein CPAV1605_1056 [seawater metagenome]|uniref:Methyltransferase domain-containing protein n=1 Tax=seawater metagenome TaxID=1561972 RepID=A0A5E8CLT9_9ZZZZ